MVRTVGRSAGIQGQVSDFHARNRPAVEDVSLVDTSSSDARSREDTHHATGIPRRAKTIFRVDTRVDIVARGVVKGCIEAGKDPAETIAIFRIPGAWEEEGFKNGGAGF